MRSPVKVEVGVGAVTLEVDAQAPWDAALEDLLTAYTASASRAAARLHVTLGHGGGGGARLPRFVDVAGALCDRSEAWDARIALDGPRGYATFGLHDGRPEPHVRRELVASALRVTLASVAPRLIDGLLVHAAAAAREHALVFIGPSGEGKTTIARRLRAAGWTALSDDAVLLTPETVTATPLRGKENDARVGGAYPLRALIFLSKGAPSLRLDALTPAEATAALLPRVFWYASAPAWEASLLEVVSRIVERVPAYRLSASLDHDVVAALEAL